MSRQRRLRDERGAVVIHVAIALMALLLFTSFVIDYGVMWVSRRQAQNVADSGALAGALASIHGGDVTQAAQHFAANNPIWGQGNSAANVDVTLSDATNDIPPCGTDPGCVRVDVFRNTPDRVGAIRGNPVPTYFASMMGLNDQGVRATATAEVASGTSVKCLLPFAVADRWSDMTDLQDDTATYPNDFDHLTNPFPPPQPGIAGWSPADKYEDLAAGGADTYATPTSTSTGTGWRVSADYGRQLVLKKGDVGDFSAGWANKVDLPGSVGSSDYRDDIKACNPAEVGIAAGGPDPPYQDCSGFPNSGTTLDEALAGCLGVSSGLTVGPTAQGIEGGGPPGPNGETDVVDQDPGAHWDRSEPSGTALDPSRLGGVVAGSGPNAGSWDPDNPRIRPIAIFDIDHYMQNPACVNQAGTGCVIRVANIIGFFIEGMCPTVKAAGQLETDAMGNPLMDCSPNPAGNNEVVGRIVDIPKSGLGGVGRLDQDASFLRVTRLAR